MFTLHSARTPRETPDKIRITLKLYSVLKLTSTWVVALWVSSVVAMAQRHVDRRSRAAISLPVRVNSHVLACILYKTASEPGEKIFRLPGAGGWASGVAAASETWVSRNLGGMVDTFPK